MGYGWINTDILADIATAIRSKLGVSTKYTPVQMPEAIQSISGGGITPTGTKSITENGTYDVASFANAEVSVPTGITPTGTKQINIAANETVTEDVTAYANAEISVNVVNQDYEDALVAFGVQSDLTDGITALTTYANSVTGESDTNLSDAVRTLADGYGASGGVKTASGTFTVSDNYISVKQIVHNLGTTRLFGMIWKEADTNDQIVASRGYDLIFSHFITHSFINDLYSGKTIVTDYTSSETKTAEHTDETNPYLRRYKSNWTNKAASWTADTSNVVNQVWGEAVDNNTINIKTASTNTYMGTGTYHWQVWALDSWVND